MRTDPSATGTVEARVNDIAARQHGVISRAQLIDLGMPVSRIDHRVRADRLVRIHQGVYRVGPISTARTHLMAATLACGSGVVVSYRTAGHLYGCLPRDADRVEVTIAGRRIGSRPGIRIHRVREFRAGDTAVRDGIPTTSVARTLLDLASVLAERELEAALSEALALKIVDRAAIQRVLAGRDRMPGAARLRALISGHEPARTRSRAEERLLALVRKAALPDPAVNVRVAGFEVDFHWRAERLVVEVDGHAFHATPRKFESDRRRDAALIAGGLRVMRVTWQQLEREPERVLAAVVRALAATPAG